jgi:hypothetical protein
MACSSTLQNARAGFLFYEEDQLRKRAEQPQLTKIPQDC